MLVYVEGEVDIMTAPALNAALSAAMDAADSSVEADLSGVALLGADGLTALIRARKTAAAKNLDFKVSGTNPLVRKVIGTFPGLENELGVTGHR